MPRKRRYALPAPVAPVNPPVESPPERAITLSDSQTPPEPDGLDRVERASRRGTKTAAERELMMERMIVHGTYVSPQMQVIHEQRFNLWKQGMSMDSIAEQLDVEEGAVTRSVNYILTRLPDEDAIRLRNQHIAAMTHLRQAKRYTKAMETLLDSTQAFALDKGMTHFERAVGLAGGGVNVLVDNRRQSVNVMPSGSAPASFEEVMDRVRGRLVAEQEAKGLLAAGDPDAIDVDVQEG